MVTLGAFADSPTASKREMAADPRRPPYSCAVVAERIPELNEHWRVFDAVVEYARQLVGPDGTEELGYVMNGQIGVCDFTPNNPRARAINIIAEQWLVVTLGDAGGRWELNYTDEQLSLGRKIIAAAVAGRVEERQVFGRSRVTVTFEDGETLSETGYNGCASLFVPQLGWTRWGALTRYEPYRGENVG